MPRARMSILNSRVVLFVLATLLGASARASDAMTSSCADAQRMATAKAFACTLVEQNKLLAGGAANFARCDSRLDESFAAAARRGCSVDVAAAAAALADAQSALLRMLEPVAPQTAQQQNCVVRKSRVIAKYALCVARALRRLAPVRDSRQQRHSLCGQTLFARFPGLEANGECLTTNDAEAARDAAGPAYGYMPGADFSDRVVGGANLPRAALSGADISRGSMSDSDLAGADLHGATLDHAVMRFMNLRDANLSDVTGSRTSFLGSDLTGANLSGADLPVLEAVGIVGCPAVMPNGWRCVQGVILCPLAMLDGIALAGEDLHGVDVHHAELAHANLSGADLRAANLSEVNFVSATLSGADLTGANLRRATFMYTDITGVTFAGADLTGVLWVTTYCQDGTYSVSNGNTCCGHLVGSPPAICIP